MCETSLGVAGKSLVSKEDARPKPTEVDVEFADACPTEKKASLAKRVAKRKVGGSLQTRANPQGPEVLELI
jgi:hypothetical protein